MNKNTEGPDVSIDELVRYAPKLFPGLAQLVEACWGWQSYDRLAELQDAVVAETTAIQASTTVVAWLETRRKSTAPLDVMKLGLEVAWLLNHLTDVDAERLLCRLGLVTPVVPSSEVIGDPYRRLLQEISLAVDDWLDARELEVPGLTSHHYGTSHLDKTA